MKRIMWKFYELQIMPPGKTLSTQEMSGDPKQWDRICSFWTDSSPSNNLINANTVNGCQFIQLNSPLAEDKTCKAI